MKSQLVERSEVTMSAAHEMQFPAYQSKATLITPEMAKEFITLNSFERQRPLNRSTVRLYADRMRRGEWTPGTPIDFGDVKGVVRLLNGQHRLHAIIDSGLPQWAQVTRHFLPDDETFASYYGGTYDTNPRRASAHALRAYGLDEEIGIPQRELRQVGAAVRFIESGFGASNVAGFDAVSEVARCREWASEARQFVSLGDGANAVVKQKILVVGFVSVALAVLRYAPHRAQEFVRAVHVGAGLATDDPRFVLREKLMSIRSRKTRQGDETMSQPYLARYAAIAWNYFAEDRPVGYALRVYDPRSPIKLLHTPYTGKTPKTPKAGKGADGR